MKRLRLARFICRVMALVLSHAGCIIVAYNYATMLCGIKHMAYSAPASIVFLWAIPFGIVVIALLIIGAICSNKIKNLEKEREMGDN